MWLLQINLNRHSIMPHFSSDSQYARLVFSPYLLESHSVRIGPHVHKITREIYRFQVTYYTHFKCIIQRRNCYD
jgi:hypothetical protein